MNVRSFSSSPGRGNPSSGIELGWKREDPFPGVENEGNEGGRRVVPPPGAEIGMEELFLTSKASGTEVEVGRSSRRRKRGK